MKSECGLSHSSSASGAVFGAILILNKGPIVVSLFCMPWDLSDAFRIRARLVLNVIKAIYIQRSF